MFSKAYQIATQFTHPLVVSTRFFDKTIETGLGAFILVNNDGWLLTAAHNLNILQMYQQHAQEMNNYHIKTAQLQQNNLANQYQTYVLPNPKWITNFVILFSGQPIQILEHYIYKENDIALIRIDKAAVKDQTVFPKFINPATINPGTSLMKLGYPFIEAKATFNENTQTFELPANLFPLPFFPIDGIYTRNINQGKTADQSMDILFLETSSPGLKGQSGGPICDTNGTIYAIQSQNLTFPLGFKGTVVENNQAVEVNQFLNVGIGVHIQTIIHLFNKHQIKFDMV